MWRKRLRVRTLGWGWFVRLCQAFVRLSVYIEPGRTMTVALWSKVDLSWIS